MSLGLIITMGSVSLGSALIEKLLGKIGKVEEANMMSYVTTAMLASTVVGSFLKVVSEVRKLN